VSTSLQNQGRPCVLVAVGDPIARELLAQMLHLAGFAVLLAPTGERALLELLERRSAIDWLITGTSLPGLVDGAILSDEFRSIHPTRPALAFSALVTDGETSPAALAGLSPAGLIAELQALAHQHSPALPVRENERVQALAA
jgi:CheY-like chemotaxis protein